MPGNYVQKSGQNNNTCSKYIFQLKNRDYRKRLNWIERKQVNPQIQQTKLNFYVVL